MQPKKPERRVDSGEMACAFTIFPTSIQAPLKSIAPITAPGLAQWTLADLMRVADAGEVMPPKPTWFEPKLADGLVSHVLD